MKPLDRIVETAKASPRRIVLAEGEDPRIVEGAIRARREGLAAIILVGNRAAIELRLVAAGALPGDFQIEDPATSALAPGLAKAYHTLRAGKGVDEESAILALRSPLVFAAMMVREGEADGTVGGAVATTADTVRAALQTIGRAPGTGLVSSFFLMMLCAPHHAKKVSLSLPIAALWSNPTRPTLLISP